MPSKPRSLFLLVVLFGPASVGLAFGVLIPMLPSLAAHFGSAVGELTAQLAFTLTGMGLVVGGPSAGWLISRHGPRRVLLVALPVFAAAGISGLALDDPLLFLMLRFVLGFAAAGTNAAAASLISHALAPVERRRALGYFNACGSVTSLVVILLSGVVAEAGGWRLPFLFYAVGFLVLALAAVAIPETRVATPRPVAIDTGRLWPTYLLIALLSIAMYTAPLQVPFLLAQHGVVRPSVVAIVMAVSSVAIALGSLAYGGARSRLGEAGVLVLALTLMSAGHVLLASAVSVPAIATGSMLSQFGAGFMLPYFLNLLMDRLPQETHGKVTGGVYASSFLASFLNPLLMGPLSTWLGQQPALLALGGMLALGAVVAGVLGSRQGLASDLGK